MDKQRIFRALVCFVLICSLVVNISPIKAKAFATETVMALGAIACIMAMYVGVVFNPQSQAQLVAIGDSFGGYISERAESLEDSLDVTELFDYWELATGGGDGDDFDPNRTKIKLARGLLKLIAGWIYTAVVTGAVEGSSSVSSEAPEGYAYYNGFLFPEIPAVGNSLTYSCIVQEINSGIYRAYFADVPLQYYTHGTSYLRLVPSAKSSYCWATLNDLGDTWSLTGIFSMNAGSFMSKDSNLIWSDHDIISNNDKRTLVLEASVPTSRPTIFVEPDFYGDIPSQIQNGSISAEDIELPENVDLSSVITSRDTLLDDISNSAQKIQDGVLSLDEYKNQIEYDDDLVGDETVPGTEPSEDPTEPEDVGPIGDYALDLTEFFPFCIPYDIKEFLSLLSAAPEAPVFEWDIVVKSWDWGFHVTVDLSPWNDVAALFRKLELLAFIVGLGFVTREKFLRG